MNSQNRGLISSLGAKKIGVLFTAAIIVIGGFFVASLPAQAATAPVLGTADDFAALGTAVTLTSSIINGDVGSTGVDITDTGSTVIGTPYPGADSAVLTAYDDFLSAYGVVADMSLAGAGDHSDGILTDSLDGVTLLPGVYSFDISSKTGTLTLDANGDSNAVWIFKSADPTGYLEATNFHVVFSGVGSASNVFWWTGAYAAVTTSDFQGTILSGAYVTVTGGTLAGRALATADVTVTTSSTVTVPTVPPTSGPVWEENGTPNGTLDLGEHFFHTIQSAIDAGTTVAGDTIHISAETYPEYVTVDKSLTLQGEGDTTIINGNINVTNDNVTIKNLKIRNSNSHDGGIIDYGVKVTAGNTLTLEAVTIDVTHNGVYMRSVSDIDPTTITINNSNIKGYAAIELADPEYNDADTNAAVSVNIENSTLTGTTSYGAGTNDYSTIGMDYIDNVIINFAGANTVANEYTEGATSKERLIWFYYANNNSVTGTIPTYTNHPDSTVTDDALFMSSVGYTNTVAGEDVASYVVGSTEFEAALASDATTIVVGGDYEAISTTKNNTLGTGTTLRIEANSPVTIASGTTLVNNGTIIIESGATLTTAGTGTIDGNGTIEANVSNVTELTTALSNSFIDTINVAAGTYNTNLTITRTVTLLGPNANIDPNTGTRVAEAIINGGGGTTLKPQATSIVINGFTISSTDAGFPIYTGGTDVTGLTVSNNIIGSGVRAVTVATNGGDISILHNKITGKGYGIHFGNGTYSNVKINNNIVNGPDDYYSIFITGTGSISGFELKDNKIYDTANIAANITNGTVTGNTFDVPSGSILGLQINLHNSTLPGLSGNTFYGHGYAACLQLMGSQNGLVPSNTVTVSNNILNDCGANQQYYTYGIQLSPDIDHITITGNTITNAYDGINTRDITSWNLTGKDIIITNNSITGSTHFAVNNTVTGMLDAENNWWGDATPDFNSILSGSVDNDPWYINPGRTILSTAISSGGGGSGTITVTTPTIDFEETTNGGVSLPDGTSNLILGNDSVLDFASSTNSVTIDGDDPEEGIFIAGTFEYLSSFMTGEMLEPVDLSEAQNIGGEDVLVEQAVQLSSGTEGEDIVLTNSELPSVEVSIPDGTTILAPSGWDGTIMPPTDVPSEGTAPSGFSVGDTVIEVGSPGVVLLFDQAVKITLTGVTGTVGYKPANSDDWKTINTQCTSADDHGNISFPDECYFSDGVNTVIWTYHFTEFGEMIPDPDPTPPSPPSGGGGGGGPLPVSNAYAQWQAQQAQTATPAPTTPFVTPSAEQQGRVLGEQTFADGAMIRATNGFDVYIVKYTPSTGSGQAAKKFKRLILNPSVFNSYQHLKWADVLNVDQSVIDSFVTSDLVRVVGDTKVYKLNPSGDTGSKQWVKTAAAFNNKGFDWSAIYEINATDRNSYATGAEIE